MADKFRVTFPIQIQFANGEQPTAAKLNAISTQARNGLAQAERAIGDVWNQSGDNVTTDYPLQIASLARVIGQQMHLNAQMPKPDLEDAETIRIVQDMSGQVGLTLLHLDYKPVTGDASILHSEIGLTRGTDIQTGTANGYYFADSDTGLVYLSEPWAGATLEYDVLGVNFKGDGLTSAPFNVIPHPNMESGWKGIKFVYVSQNKYLAYLPPRRPLTSSASEIGKIPRSTNNSITPETSTQDRYWYSSEANWLDNITNPDYLAFATAKRYRHRLPDFLYDIVTAGSLGQQLPTGSIYLWDNTQNTIVEGITFKVPEADTSYGGGLRPGWVIQIEGTLLDSLLGEAAGTSLITTDDPTDYSAESRFSIVTVGESLAEKLKMLGTALLSDLHGTDAAQRIPHENLTNLQPSPRSGFDTMENLPPAYRTGDDHSQYLSREGSTATALSQRDAYNNGMNGDLLLLSTTTTSDKQNVTADSRQIKFGRMTGPSIYHRYSSAAPALYNRNATAATSNSWLSLSDAPVYLGRGVLAFGTATGGADGSYFPGASFSGIDCDTTVSNQDSGDGATGAWFRLFGDNRVDRSGLSVGELAVIGHSYNVTTGQSASAEAHRYGAATNFIKIGSYSSINRISFAGGILDLSDYSGSEDVTIGTYNSGTDLRLSNSRLQFGTAGNAAILEYAGSNIFQFKTPGELVNGTYLRAGTISAYDGSYRFDSSTVNRIDYSAGTFYFLVNTSSFQSTLLGNIFWAQSNFFINKTNASTGFANSWIVNDSDMGIGVVSSNRFGLYRDASSNLADLSIRDLTASAISSASISATGSIYGVGITSGTAISAGTTIAAGTSVSGENFRPNSYATDNIPATNAAVTEYNIEKALLARCTLTTRFSGTPQDPTISTNNYNIDQGHANTQRVGIGKYRLIFDHPISTDSTVTLTCEFDSGGGKYFSASLENGRTTGQIEVQLWNHAISILVVPQVAIAAVDPIIDEEVKIHVSIHGTHS